MSDDRCPEHNCDIAACFEEHNMKDAARLAFETLVEERDRLKVECAQHIEAAANKELDWFSEKRRADLLEAKCVVLAAQKLIEAQAVEAKAIRRGHSSLGVKLTTAEVLFVEWLDRRIADLDRRLAALKSEEEK
jgi:hypothetical protein